MAFYMLADRISFFFRSRVKDKHIVTVCVQFMLKFVKGEILFNWIAMHLM